jgi:hypothetical protein
MINYRCNKIIGSNDILNCCNLVNKKIISIVRNIDLLLGSIGNINDLNSTILYINDTGYWVILLLCRKFLLHIMQKSMKNIGQRV